MRGGIRKRIMQMNGMIVFMRVMGSKIAVIIISRIIVWVMREIDRVMVMSFFLLCIINSGISIMRQ